MSRSDAICHGFPTIFSVPIDGDGSAPDAVANCDRIPLRRNIRFRPYAFTEYGVTMLSAVLRSERAVAVSVAVVRAFVRLRQLLAGNAEWPTAWMNWNSDQRITTAS